MGGGCDYSWSFLLSLVPSLFFLWSLDYHTWSSVVFYVPFYFYPPISYQYSERQTSSDTDILSPFPVYIHWQGTSEVEMQPELHLYILEKNKASATFISTSEETNCWLHDLRLVSFITEGLFLYCWFDIYCREKRNHASLLPWMLLNDSL